MDTANPEPLTAEEEIELQKEIDIAIEPFKDITPPALLAQMRERLEEGLRTHPVPRSLLKRFAPRPAVGSSGTVARGDGADDEKAGGDKEGA